MNWSNFYVFLNQASSTVRGMAMSDCLLVIFMYRHFGTDIQGGFQDEFY